MQSSSLGKSPQVVRVGCQDLVTITCQTHDCSVDRIGPPASAQKQPRSFAETNVQRFDVDPGEKPRQHGLAPHPAAPHLCDDAPMRERCTLCQALTFDQGHDVAVSPFDSDESARVQDETQAAPCPRPDGGRSLTVAARTTVAWVRARRAAAPISSSVISPCSAS